MPVRAHLLVVGQGFAAAFELAGDGFLFVDEQHHDVDRRLPEMDAERGAVEIPAQRVHLVDEKLEALDLHLGARKAVEDDAIAVFRLEEFAQQQSDNLAIADHVAGVLQGPRLRGVEQGADHDR
jgi:hypothetical protein